MYTINNIITLKMHNKRVILIERTVRLWRSEGRSALVKELVFVDSKESELVQERELWDDA